MQSPTFPSTIVSSTRASMLLLAGVTLVGDPTVEASNGLRLPGEAGAAL